jgi:N-acetylmuramoyl-L-alanine amidase
LWKRLVDKWKKQPASQSLEKGTDTMHNETWNIIRVALLILLVLAFAIFVETSAVEELPTVETAYIADEPEQTEPTTTEPPTTESATAKTEPTTATIETEPTTIAEETTTQEETIVPETTAPETTEPELPYTEEELEMMAIVIYQEAGGNDYSDETRLMVGTVVMNRIADERFPDTMYEVLTAPRQYGRLHWTGIVWPDRASNPYEAEAIERAYAIAERILLGERAFDGSVVYQAEFPQGVETVVYQDGMYFCR